MREDDFRKYLINNNDIKSKEKAVTSRIAKALRVEKELNIDLEIVVKDDELMYVTLLQIEEKLNDRHYHNVYQNAVRKYFLFVNGKEFPRIKQYERTRKRIL